MSNHKKKLRRVFHKKETTEGTPASFIQPFVEKPSINDNDTGEESIDRINAHELFSFYTADIIKDDVVFIR